MAPTENFPARRGISQTPILFCGFILLEALFWRLRRFGNLETFVVETIATGLAAGAIYFIALYGLEHTRERRGAFWLVLAAAILFRATLWPLAPTLSNDLYRYRWDGRAQLRGENPYLATPNDARLRGLRDPSNSNDMRMPAQEIPTIYPPLAELVFRTAARFLHTPVAFKLPMEAADVLTMILLAVWLRAAGGRAFQLAIYAWNPLVVIEFAGSAHSDALALVALAGAFVIIKSRPTLSTLLLACAALLKSFPIMLFPLWLWRQGWPKSRRAWANGFAAAALAAGAFPRSLDGDHFVSPPPPGEGGRHSRQAAGHRRRVGGARLGNDGFADELFPGLAHPFTSLGRRRRSQSGTGRIGTDVMRRSPSMK
jgi:hypothetical protein